MKSKIKSNLLWKGAFGLGSSVALLASVTVLNQHVKRPASTPLGKEVQSILTHLSMIQTAKASSGYTQSVTNMIRNAIGTAVGYSDAGYLALACGGSTSKFAAGTCDGPPQSGIVGAAVTLAASLQTIATNGGVASCSAVPSSGTLTANDASGTSQTLTFQTPTHTVPSSWLNGGTAFQKRVKAPLTLTLAGTATPVVMAMEFNCDSSVSYLAITMTIANGGVAGQNGTGFTRNIAVFSGPVSASTNGFDVYYAEAVPSGSSIGTGQYLVTGPAIRGGMGMKIEYNPTLSTFNAWSALIGTTNNLTIVGHMIASGNYSTQQSSLYYSGVAQTGTSGAIPISTMDAAQATSMADDSLGTATAYDLAGDLSSVTTGTAIKKQGCVTFSSPDTAPTSAALCSGFALSAASSAPAIDSTGKFSPDWLLSTLPTKLETVK